MQLSQNASPEQARRQSLALLNQHLAAAVILHDRMQHSPRNLWGANFIMMDGMCAQVSSLMETCSTLITARMADLDGTAGWPVGQDLAGQFDGVNVRPAQRGLRRLPMANPIVMAQAEMEPLDAFGQSVLDAATVAEAYGDTTTAEVMAQVWRCVERQLWSVEISTVIEN